MVEMEGIRIQGRNTMSDFAHAVQTFIGRHRAVWVFRIIGVALMVIGLNLLADPKTVGYGITYIAISLVLLFNVANLALMWLAVKKTSKLLDPYEAVFNEMGMQFKSPGAESKVEWSFYNRLIETRRVFLLCYDKAAFIILPKHAFSSQEQIDAFRELAKSHIG